MPPVFAHGRLRLYLLKLLDEAPRHGYEVIRLLEERFHGLYAPSAGTVYPRLAKLEAEGLVTHTTEGGRKVYSLTDAGRAELTDREGELADLELEIRESVAELAAEIREDVRGSASDLRRQIREAAAQARATGPAGTGGPTGPGAKGSRGGAAPWAGGSWADPETWRQAKEELRRAKEESRRAKQDAQRARREAKDARDFAREEVERIAHRLHEQTQAHLRTGDWQGALREGLSEVTRAMARAGQGGHYPWAPWESTPPGSGAASDRAAAGGGQEATGDTVGARPDWASVDDTDSADPARDLERLLDRFRDDVRDTARDRGVTPGQLAEIRSALAATSARVDGVLRAHRPQ